MNIIEKLNQITYSYIPELAFGVRVLSTLEQKLILV